MYNKTSTMIAAERTQGMAAHLSKIIFDEDATAADLMTIVFAFGILWYVVFYIIKRILRPLVHNKPWLIKALERDYERSGKKMIEDLNIQFTKEEFIAWAMNDWPRMQGISLQHFVGSLFCIPSLLGSWGGMDPSVASSLAICGVLCEMGWELQDMTEMLFVRTFCKNGKAIWPDSIIVIFALHHSLTTILGVPMVLYYRNLKSLHWICFNLQFAAAVALSVAEYLKTLDVSNPSHLRRFKVLNFIALVIMVWTRIIHWSYLCMDMFLTWYHDDAWTFLALGVVLSIAFTAFSYLCVVKPFYKKFLKFLHVSAEYETLPLDVTPDKRRSSVIQLDKAVGELLADDEMKEIADFLAPIFIKRKVSRRQSVPVSNRRRRSLLMLQAKKAASSKNM